MAQDGCALLCIHEKRECIVQQQETYCPTTYPLSILAVAPLIDIRPDDLVAPLNDTAMMVLQQQEDAQRMDLDLRQLRFDDDLLILAARRGLLVRFLIKSLRSYAMPAELVVEAPEHATVDCLRRRIFRGKLQRGEVV